MMRLRQFVVFFLAFVTLGFANPDEDLNGVDPGKKRNSRNDNERVSNNDNYVVCSRVMR